MTEQEQVRLSRELDLKVARLVMGYAHFRFPREDGTTFVQLMTREDANTRYIRILNPVEVESGDEDNAPRYSADIGLAFEVVEKMRELSWWFMLDTISGWHAQFGKDSLVTDEKDSTPVPTLSALPQSKRLNRGMPGKGLAIELTGNTGEHLKSPAR